MGPHVADQLSAYMDGELREPERGQVEAHLRGCAGCARHLEELRAVDAAARALPLAVPDGYFEAFRGRLRQRLERPRPVPRRFAPAWALAAAAALVLAVLTPRLLREPRVPAPAPAAELRAAPSVAPPPAEAPVGGTPAAPPAAAEKQDVPLARTGPSLRRVAPAPPPVTAEAPAQEYARNATGAAAEGYAAPPPEADQVPGRPAESAPQARMEAESGAPAREDESKTRRDKAALGAVRDQAARAPASEVRFLHLRRRTASSAAEARALREAWRALARDEGAGPRADEARVRTVEAGAEAWRLGKDEGDRALARRDARAYLDRPDARQPDRVRDVLRSLLP